MKDLGLNLHARMILHISAPPTGAPLNEAYSPMSNARAGYVMAAV